jgi:hypothetical protein
MGKMNYKTHLPHGGVLYDFNSQTTYLGKFRHFLHD